MEYSRDFNIFINGIQNNLTTIFSKVSKTKGRRDPLPRKIQNFLSKRKYLTVTRM